MRWSTGSSEKIDDERKRARQCCKRIASRCRRSLQLVATPWRHDVRLLR
jgi:hypothetical protein